MILLAGDENGFEFGLKTFYANIIINVVIIIVIIIQLFY